MKISVITPVYNGEKYIRATVESVIRQTGDFELEYIVCDGMSTDKTLAILDEYKDRCRIYSEKDGSPQAAINKGMALATGDIAVGESCFVFQRPGDSVDFLRPATRDIGDSPMLDLAALPMAFAKQYSFVAL